MQIQTKFSGFKGVYSQNRQAEQTVQAVQTGRQGKQAGKRAGRQITVGEERRAMSTGKNPKCKNKETRNTEVLSEQ